MSRSCSSGGSSSASVRRSSSRSFTSGRHRWRMPCACSRSTASATPPCCRRLCCCATTRVQSDVKSSLAYAALTQVGIIVVEIAIGWYVIAFVHLVGHACFRLLQFLSAPNVLHDLHGMEDAIGDRASPAGGYLEAVTSGRVRRGLFLIALERGFLDSILDRVVVEPFTRLARTLTRLDQWLCDAVMPTRQPVAVERGDQDE